MDCRCDEACHSFGDCCRDIAEIGCYPVSSSSRKVTSNPTVTPGKTKSEDNTKKITTFVKFTEAGA